MALRLRDNELVAFIDFLLPLTRVPIAVIHQMIRHYHQQQHRRALLHGDTLQVWEEELDTMLSTGYYPSEYHENFLPLLQKLAVRRLTHHTKTVKILEFFLMVTILCHGKLRDKAQLLYFFFAITEPEGMLEWEHSQLIQTVSNCLKKIGAIKSSEISVDDANHLAFLARIKEDRKGFYPSLSFNEFFHWIQNSSETSPAFVFIRLINQFLRICQSLNQRMDSLVSLLSEITSDNYSTQTIAVPKLSSNYTFLPLCPHLLLLTDKSAHFILHYTPRFLESFTECENFFVQIDTIHPSSSLSDHLPSCWERYYTTTTRHKLTPIVSKNSLTLRLDVLQGLTPDTPYFITLYTISGFRLPVVSLRTRPSQTAISQSIESNVMIHPCTLTLTRLTAFLTSLPDIHFNNLVTIFTGWLLPPVEKIYSQLAALPFRPGLADDDVASLMAMVTDIIHTFVDTSWMENEKELLKLFPQANIAVDGLVNHLTGSRQLLTFRGSDPTTSLESHRFNSIFPRNISQSIQKALETSYLNYLRPYLTPTSFLEMGEVRLYFVQPHDYGLPDSCGTTCQEIVRNIQYLYGLPTSPFRHLVLIMNSPRDLLKHPSRWHENDGPQAPLATEQKQNDSEEPKLRGKHELIHGAYSATPKALLSLPVQDHPWSSNHRNEIRKGGDSICNSVIRVLYKWLSISPPGHRRVSLVSTGWINGIDFALSLDGQAEHIITHHSLEATVENENKLQVNDQEMIQRIRLSFNERVALEVSPLSHPSRTLAMKICSGSGSRSSLEFVPHLQDIPASLPIQQTKELQILQSFIHELTHDRVAIEVRVKGHGSLHFDLYEVPIVATTNDVMRLMETELDQMTLLRSSIYEIISANSLIVRFDQLTSYCSYAIHVHAAPDLSSSFSPISPQQLVHFRTYLHEERNAVNIILAALSEEECLASISSEIFPRLQKELDCYMRPTAAPIQLIHTDVRLLPNVVFHQKFHRPPPSGPQDFSLDYHSLSRKTHVVTSGFFDYYWHGSSYGAPPQLLPLPPPPSIYLDRQRSTEYEGKYGGVDVSLSRETCRFSLQLNTRKSLRCLLENLVIISEMKSIRNILIFSPKPLIPYSERRYPDHNCWSVKPPSSLPLDDRDYLLWEKSKHFSDPEYLSLLSKLLDWLYQWKSLAQCRKDCQIISIGHTPEVILSYFHDHHVPYFHGVRHITLPISLGLTQVEERMIFPKEEFSFVSFAIKSFRYQNGQPPNDLPTLSPFHFIPPLFPLHGTNETILSVTRPIYRITVLTEDLLENKDDIYDRGNIVGSHHDLVIKQIVHDIDSLEVTLGPIVGNVTYTTCGILFEMNRRVDQLRCLLVPVEYPDQSRELILSSNPSHCLKYEFQELLSGIVYEIFLPEIHGKEILGKFRTLSTKTMYSEVLFLGEETLEYFPVTKRILSDLQQQQVLSFNLIGLESFVKAKLQKAASHDSSLLSRELPYRRPWNSVRSKMKEISCSTSVVIHIGSHALLCRIFREVIPPLIEIVKKYRLDDEIHLKTSALSMMYHFQLVQVIEDTLRAIWIMEPSVKEVFQNAANIPLYNNEYWLREDILVDSSSPRDYLAFDILRKLYEEGLQKYLYSLRDWNSRSYHHFFQWREGSMTIAALDFASEQMESLNKSKLKRIQTTNVSSGSDGRASMDENDGGDEHLDDIKATTFSADFMSENQWKHLRGILTDKSINQLVICSQNPLIPLEMLSPNDDDVAPLTSSWKPSESNIIKLFEQLFKWLIPPKKSLEHYKNLTIVCTSDYSYVTNIQDVKSGMKIQQICLGKFSCIPEAHRRLNNELSTYQLNGKLGGIRYAHRVCGLDVVVLDSSRTGGGGRYSGSTSMWHQPGDAVYALLRYWFDSWKAIGTCNFYPVHPTGFPETLVGEEAVLLVGPIVGAPYLRDGSKMMVPILLEVDRDVTMTMIATELFSGKQMTLTLKLIKFKPTLIRIGPLQLDSRYTMEFIEGIQNSHAFKFVLQTSLSWIETNIVVINASPQEDPSKNSSEFVRDIIKRFQVPFHGLTTVLHTDVEVDVGAIMDEARTQPELNEMIQEALKGTSSASPGPSVRTRLKEYVTLVMNRVRAEYRMYLCRPSYRELLLRAFNLFMHRENEELTFFEDDERFLSQHGSSGSLTSLLKLIVSRVRQEYFDQFLFPDDRLYAAWPRIRRTKEMIADELTKKRLQSEKGVTMKGKMMVLTTDNCDDEEILKYPRPRLPDRLFSSASMDPVDSVLQQWMEDLIPTPPLWNTWISPNRRLSIERLCSDSDDNIKEIYERIFNEKIPTSSRILVLPSIGNLFDQENRVGFKLQEWIQRWIGQDPNRSLSLFCPSSSRSERNEGTYLYTIEYLISSSPDSSSSSQLVIQLLNSIYSSNEKEIQKVKGEKISEMKKKLSAKGSVTGRRAIAKRKEEEEKLRAEIQAELNQILDQFTPDGYVIYESKTYTENKNEATGNDLIVTSTALRCISSREEFDSNGQSMKPTYYDYINLPEWFLKFCPCTSGVFVQDEVILLMRQDPHYREFLAMLEEDSSLLQEYRKAYESSRLSELSRPQDLREVDMSVPGILEMFLENTIEKIWNTVLPSLLKGKLFTLTDDFIRSYCLSRAFSDIQTSLSSSLAFAKAIRSMLFSCALLFLACKMATGPERQRWEYILQTEEFVEDGDEELKKGLVSDEEEEEEGEEGEDDLESGQKKSDLEGEENQEGEEGNGGEVEQGEDEKEEVVLSRDEIILRLQARLWELSGKRVERRRRYGEAMSYMSSSPFI